MDETDHQTFFLVIDHRQVFLAGLFHQTHGLFDAVSTQQNRRLGSGDLPCGDFFAHFRIKRRMAQIGQCDRAVQPAIIINHEQFGIGRIDQLFANGRHPVAQRHCLIFRLHDVGDLHHAQQIHFPAPAGRKPPAFKLPGKERSALELVHHN